MFVLAELSDTLIQNAHQLVLIAQNCLLIDSEVFLDFLIEAAEIVISD